ncbi:MAG: GAF domain-containing protein, partial [Leptolyngbya sp. DLM2.Bin15]
YRQGATQAIADVHQAGLAQCYVELLDQFQVKANLVAPIISGDRLWGLMVAQHCTAPRHWEAWEVSLMTQLATQVAIAIQQAGLYRQLQNLNSNLDSQVQDRTQALQRSLNLEAILQRITDRVRDSLNEHSILQSTVQEVTQGLNALGGRISLYDLPAHQSRIYYEYSELSCAYVGRTISMEDAPGLYQPLLERQAVYYCPCCLDPVWGKQSFLIYPIFDDQGPLGDLCLFDHCDRLFSIQEHRLVQQVASQCAIALRQSRLYRAAQQQVDQLERLNHLKDEFLSTISHELRTPIANIRMATQVIEIVLKQLGLLDTHEHLARYLSILHEEGQRELDLINDLLNLSQLEAEEQSDTLDLLDLKQWLPHLVDSFSDRIQQHHHLLLLDLPDELPILQIESLYFERVLLELMNNACKYTPAEGMIQLVVRAKRQGIELQLSNTCLDLTPDECEHMFDTFYRIPNRDPWKHGGTGLGLALVKKLMARLEGTIQVSSQDNQVTFTVWVPILDEDSASLDV